MYIVAGLGNPGEEYELTRHNTGRMIVFDFAKRQKFPASPTGRSDWVFDKKINALKTEACLPARQGKIGGGKVLLILPETMMNNSGNAVQKFITSKQKAKHLIIVHDDLDLPLGRFKISFARGSAGHKGVESVIKKIKTIEFIRVRVGISPKKPARNASRSEAGGKPEPKELVKFLLGKFTPKDLIAFKKVSKKISEALESIISDGLQKAMSQYN